MQTDLYSIPGDEVVHRLARLDAPGQRETRAIERLKSWDRELGPETIAGTDLPGLPAAPGPRLRSRRDRRPRPGRALPRPLRQRLHHPRHLPLALARPPAGPLGGGRRGADRPPLGRPRAGGAARRARRPRAALRAATPRAGAGAGARAALPARARRGQPRRSTGSSTAPCTSAAPRRRSRRSPMTRTIPTTRSGRRAGAWSPTRWIPAARCWQDFTGQSGHAWSEHYDDLQPRWLAGQMQSMAGEGPWQTLGLTPAGR